MTKKHMNWGWLFVSPFVLSLLVFSLFPIVFSGYISFTHYDMFNPPRMAGVYNFVAVWKTPEFWTSIRNVFTYAIITISLQVFFGSVLATMLNNKIKGMRIFRTIYFLPVLTPMIAITFVWLSLYNPTYGVLNYAFSLVGIPPQKFVFSANWLEAIGSVAIMNVWKTVGFTTIFLLAGIQAISEELSEAVMIDGAGQIRKFFTITLPLLSPTIFFLVVTNLISATQSFDQFYVIAANKGYGGASLDVPGTLIYGNAFLYSKMGLASAMGWILFAIVATLTYIQKSAEKRWVFYG